MRSARLFAFALSLLCASPAWAARAVILTSVDLRSIVPNDARLSQRLHSLYQNEIESTARRELGSVYSLSFKSLADQSDLSSALLDREVELVLWISHGASGFMGTSTVRDYRDHDVTPVFQLARLNPSLKTLGIIACGSQALLPVYRQFRFDLRSDLSVFSPSQGLTNVLQGMENFFGWRVGIARRSPSQGQMPLNLVSIPAVEAGGSPRVRIRRQAYAQDGRALSVPSLRVEMSTRWRDRQILAILPAVPAGGDQEIEFAVPSRLDSTADELVFEVTTGGSDAAEVLGRLSLTNQSGETGHGITTLGSVLYSMSPNGLHFRNPGAN